MTKAADIMAAALREPHKAWCSCLLMACDCGHDARAIVTAVNLFPLYEAVREALGWFIDNAPVQWDEDMDGCRYCGSYYGGKRTHRKSCEYMKSLAALDALQAAEDAL